MLERDILVAQEASAAPTAASEPGAAQFKLAGPHCAPCGLARAASSVCMGLVMILVGVVYVPMVINSTVRGPLAVLDVGIFHVLLLLLLASYLQAVFTDAGSTPAGWHDMIASQPETVRRNYKLCPKTHMYRPPRSHYDSVTRRVVLNMDHFCPWIANTVGYYNKKYFVLFLLYVWLATGYSALSLCAAATTFLPPASRRHSLSHN